MIDVGVLMIRCTTGVVVYGYILDACERGKVGSHCVVGKDEQSLVVVVRAEMGVSNYTES